MGCCQTEEKLVCLCGSFQWNESSKVFGASAKLAWIHPCALLHLGHTKQWLSALLAQQRQLADRPNCSKILYLFLMWRLERFSPPFCFCPFLPSVTPGKRPQSVVCNHTIRELHLVNKPRFNVAPFSADNKLGNSDWLGQQSRPLAAGFHRDESHLQPVEHVAAHPEQAQLRALAELLRQRQLNSKWLHLTEAPSDYFLIRETQQKAILPEVKCVQCFRLPIPQFKSLQLFIDRAENFLFGFVF